MDAKKLHAEDKLNITSAEVVELELARKNTLSLRLPWGVFGMPLVCLASTLSLAVLWGCFLCLGAILGDPFGRLGLPLGSRWAPIAVLWIPLAALACLLDLVGN